MGLLLFVLAGVVAVMAAVALAGGRRPDTGLAGIAITAAALIAMPIFAWIKRRAARAVKNRTLVAGAMQSATNAYAAGITLVRLALNGAFHTGLLLAESHLTRRLFASTMRSIASLPLPAG